MSDRTSNESNRLNGSSGPVSTTSGMWKSSFPKGQDPRDKTKGGKK